MLITVIVVVVVAAGAVVVKLTWRPSADEEHSIRNYRSTVGTMAHLAEKQDYSTPRTTEPTGEPVVTTSSSTHPATEPGHRTAEGDVARVVTPVPVRGNEEFPDPVDPLVFDVARPRDRRRLQGAEEVAPEFRSEHARQRALQSMNHGSRRWALVVVASAILVAFATLAVVGSHRSHPVSGSGANSGTSSKGTTRSTSAGNGHHPRVASPGHRAQRKPTPSTTTLTPTQIVAVSTTSTSAVYPVGSTTYHVTVTAAGLCWIRAFNPSTGATVWVGTIQPGASQDIAATGTLSVEMGAPLASVTVDNVPVVFPIPLRAPFTMTFHVPSTPGSTPGSAPGSTSGSTVAPAGTGG
jgi:hypothetical protein